VRDEAMSAGTVTFDADEYLELLDELTDLEKRLRSLGSKGFNGSGRGKTTSPANKPKENDKPTMVVDLDISGIEWKKSNRDGGGPAGPNDGWAWAFAYDQDGEVLQETTKLLQALEQYGAVRVGQYEITLGGRDKNLLNRKKLTTRGR